MIFILSTKSKKAWRWSSAVEPVSPLYMGRYFKYIARNALRLARKTKAAYLAYTIGWNVIVVGGVWGVCVDDEEEEDEKEEEEGDWGGVWLRGGEEGGDLLNDFKGVLRTNFGTCEGIPSLVQRVDLNIQWWSLQVVQK